MMPAHPTPRFPGPQSAAMIKELSRYVLADPYPFCVDLEKSEGMWLVTVEGELHRRSFDLAKLMDALGIDPTSLVDA